MRGSFISVLALAAMMVPASATDTSSLSAFVRSCSSDAKGCSVMTLSAIHSARSAKYGCIPADISDDDAGDKLLYWLKSTANADPKYANEALPDLMWTGIDELWPCKK